MLFLMLIHGCATVNISQDYPLNTDYSALKTYAWQSEKQEKTGDLRLDNPLLDTRIRSAIDTFLIEKGYQRIFNVEPDFYIAYYQEIYSRITIDQREYNGAAHLIICLPHEPVDWFFVFVEFIVLLSATLEPWNPLILEP